jgi:cytosine/adenosine deaminase-related metal-dependent hydrolase
MNEDYDILIRDAYLYKRGEIVDIGIRDGTIVRIDECPSDETARKELEADGNLVSPGFVDSHVHMDKAFTASGERFPKFNDESSDFSSLTEFEIRHQSSLSTDEIRENALRFAKQAITNGTLHMRTHVNIGEEIGGTRLLEAILDVRDQLEGTLDLQIVLMPLGGILRSERAEELVREGLEMGADVIGGADPATRNQDIEQSLETWFDLAKEYDVELDPHIQHPSTLGVHVLNRLAEKTSQAGMGGRVTASHSYCLAEMAGLEHDSETPGLTPAELKTFGEGELETLLPRFKAAGMKFVTCHPSTRPGMPLAEFADLDIPVGWGTDNVSDWIVRHAQPDALQGALVNAFKLDYNLYSFASNKGLDILWQLCTDGGARVLSIEDEYGISEGNPADLVVHDEPSPQWAIINQATRKAVIKDGNLVAIEGELIEDFNI